MTVKPTYNSLHPLNGWLGTAGRECHPTEVVRGVRLRPRLSPHVLGCPSLGFDRSGPGSGVNGMSKKRKKRLKIAKQVEAEVLFANDHTCCMCHESSRDVLIHHINEDPSDNRPGNLAVVCLLCSNRIHRKSSASKGYSAAEVRHYKRLWEQAVAKRREYLALPRVKESIREIDLCSGLERHIEREVPYLDGLALKALEVVPEVELAEGEGRALQQARRIAAESGSADRLLFIAGSLKRGEPAHASRKMVLSRLCLAIGDAKFHESDYASAESHYQEALEYAESTNESAILEICLGELAAAVGMQGRHEHALRYLDRLVALNPDDPAAWYNRGICLLALNKPKEALGASTRAIELGREAEAWTVVARSYLNAGVAQDMAGDPERAIELYKQAIHVGRDADEWSTVARAYYNAGKACGALGNHQGEVEYYLKAIETGTNAADWSTVADAHGNLGAAQLQFGKVREALESWRMAVKSATKARDWGAVGDAWFRIGLVHAQEGEYQEALKSHVKAVDCSTRSTQRLGVAKGWYGAGLAQARMGDHESAIGSYSRAIEAALHLNDYQVAAAAWLQLGGEQLILERYQEAIESGHQMIECAKKADDWDGVAAAHNLIALAYSGLDHYREALESLQKAIEVGTRNEAWTRVSFSHYWMGKVHRELGNHGEALESWQRALDLGPFLPDNGAAVLSSTAESICVLGLQAAVEDNLGRARQQAQALAEAHFNAREGGAGQVVLEALAEFGDSVPNGQREAFEGFRQLVMDSLEEPSG
jgi:tetratricopeptide (TPR) repeat protein